MKAGAGKIRNDARRRAGAALALSIIAAAFSGPAFAAPTQSASAGGAQYYEDPTGQFGGLTLDETHLKLWLYGGTMQLAYAGTVDSALWDVYGPPSHGPVRYYRVTNWRDYRHQNAGLDKFCGMPITWIGVPVVRSEETNVLFSAGPADGSARGADDNLCFAHFFSHVAPADADKVSKFPSTATARPAQTLTLQSVGESRLQGSLSLGDTAARFSGFKGALQLRFVRTEEGPLDLRTANEYTSAIAYRVVNGDAFFAANRGNPVLCDSPIRWLVVAGTAGRAPTLLLGDRDDYRPYTRFGGFDACAVLEYDNPRMK